MPPNIFGTGGQVLRQRPTDRRRSRLAEQLLAQGSSTAPAGHPLEAAGRVAQALSGAFISKQLESKEQERQQGVQDTLADALTSGTQMADGEGGGLGGIGGKEAMIRALQGNPDTAPLALQLQFGDIQSQQDLQNKLRLARETRKIEGPKGLISPEAEAQRIRLQQSGQILPQEAEEQKRRIAQAGRAQNIGTIPPGFQLVQEGNTFSMVPIPGSPAEQEITAGEEQRAERQQQEETTADVVISDIERVKDITKRAKVPVTGFGSFLSNVPATAAKDVSSLLDTIKANAGFDRLQQMRNNSPTGGALGQVSEFENRLLQATIGSLDQAQSEEQFLRNLDRVQSIYSRVIHEGIKPGEENLDLSPETKRLVGTEQTSNRLSDEDLLKGLGLQ